MRMNLPIVLTAAFAALVFVSSAGIVAAQSGTKATPTPASGEAAEERTKTLVVYFSASGNTEKMAAHIHEIVGGDIVALTPVVAYPTEYNALIDYAKDEQSRNLRPAFEELDIDPTTYETVFIGYPIWWYTVPQIILTFFDAYDFADVTLVPFNTHHGSGNAGTFKLIAELEPDATVLDGLALRGVDIEKEASAKAVKTWLEGIGF